MPVVGACQRPEVSHPAPQTAPNALQLYYTLLLTKLILSQTYPSLSSLIVYGVLFVYGVGRFYFMSELC